MASRRYRDKPEVEEKFVRQELIAGWIAIADQLVCLSLLVVFAVLAVASPGEWRLALGGGGVSLLGLVVARMREGRRP